MAVIRYRSQLAVLPLPPYSLLTCPAPRSTHHGRAINDDRASCGLLPKTAGTTAHCGVPRAFSLPPRVRWRPQHPSNPLQL